MILNPDALLSNYPPLDWQRYKLGLLRYFLLDPLGEYIDLTITSAYRSQDEQTNLKDGQGNPVPASRKAKGTSQHILGEAVDIVTSDLKATWIWVLRNLRPYQAILYWDKQKPTEIHLSLPSERDGIERKRLIYVDGEPQWWRGFFPDEAGVIVTSPEPPKEA